VLKKGGFADTCLAVDDEGAALSTSAGAQERLDDLAFVASA
jgi:hypothetical protein